MELNKKIFIEDNLETLKKMEDNSIGCIITDIPYGFNFQGNAWDFDLPSVEFLEGCFRVLKDGAWFVTTLVPRLDLQTEFCNRLKQAGFDIHFTPIYWAFSNGLSKASRLLDAEGNKTDVYRGFLPKPAVEVIITAMKPVVQKTYQAQFDDNGCGVTYLAKCKIPFDVTKEDTRREGSSWGKTLVNSERAENGLTLEEQENRLEGRTCPNFICSHAHDVTLEALLDIKKECGKFINLELEVTLFAYEKGYKPIIENANPKLLQAVSKIASILGFLNECEKDVATFLSEPNAKTEAWYKKACDVLFDGVVTKSSGGNGSGFTGAKTYGGIQSNPIIENGKNGIGKGDMGSATRYFSLDEWWAKKVSTLPNQIKINFPFLFVAKPTQTEKNAGVTTKKRKNKRGIGVAYEGKETIFTKEDEFSGNTHDTVKPVKLYAYLIELFANPDHIIYEPFLGSGTTAVACEMLGRNWVASEMSAEYADIAKKRIFNEERKLKLF